MAGEDGIRTIVATPHRRHPQYDVPPEAARRAHASLLEALRAAGVGVEVLLGHEIHYSDDIVGGLRSGDLLRLGGSPRWFLFELPDSHVPGNLERMIFDMHLAGQYPVLAHPERNAELAEDAKRLAALRRQGVPVQVTAMAVTGEFGRRAQKTAERWLRDGLVDILATDAHGTGRRPPRLAAAVKRAAEIAGEEAARRMVEENPGRILRGEALE
jgi:protein-tyrosine phosphatase